MLRPNHSLPEVIEILHFELSRSEIEQHSTERALKWLNHLITDPSIAWANRNKLVLWVSGYDSDPRELYEIPEVCRFLQTIHSKWKLWFFFASHLDYTLTTLLACICGAKKISQDVSQLPSEKVQQFVLECTHAMNFIFDTWNFPEEENKRLFFGAMEIIKPVS